MKDEAIGNSTFKIIVITPAYHTSQTLELKFHINLSFQNSYCISEFSKLWNLLIMCCCFHQNSSDIFHLVGCVYAFYISEIYSES